MNIIDSTRVGAFGVFVALAFAFDAAAQSEITCDTTVTGQNNPDVDVAAVTAAVNSPLSTGAVTVCLAGTFDFGLPVPANSISVPIVPNPTVSSLRIIGLNDVNGHKPTIRNGTQPLTLAPPAVLPNLIIENLRFVSPSLSAITLLRANQTVRIAGINVVGVRTFTLPGIGLQFRNGISVSAALAPIAGDIVIEGNVLNGGAYTAADTTIAVSAGISLVGANTASDLNFPARVTVRDNRLNDWSGAGIYAAGLNDATIENNRIDTGAFANQVLGCSQGNGVPAASGIAVAYVTNSLVRDNVVNVVPSLTGTGAVPSCTAGLIATGIAAGGTANNIFYRNRIRGGGSYALIVGATGFGTETDNVFALNPVANFVPTTATLLLGPAAADNVLIGDFPTMQGNVAGNDLVTR